MRSTGLVTRAVVYARNRAGRHLCRSPILECAMSDKPSYLGLLNAIAVAEAAAEGYLNCWGRHHRARRRPGA